MKANSCGRKALAGALLCCGWFLSQPSVSWAQVGTTNSTGSRGGFTLGTLNGVFTVEDFKVVNGISEAAGWLTGTVTDPSGTNQIGVFTNFPMRVPVSGILSGNPIQLGVGDPVILPTLSTNTCDILGIVVGDIDVTVPGLGLNVHVNQISIIARSDRETTIGKLLCDVLGGGGALGLTNLVAGGTPPGGSPGAGSAQLASPASTLTAGQFRGLLGILLGGGLGAAGAPMVQPASAAMSAGNSSSSNGLGAPGPDLSPAILQDLLGRVIMTMVPTASATPEANPTRSPKGPQPNKPAAP